MRGVLGLRAQSMSGDRRELRLYKVYRYRGYRTVSAANTGTFVMPETGYLDIYGFGPGGAGGESRGTNATSGAGGDACKKRVWATKGTPFAYSVARGSPATITLPNGVVLSAAKGGDGTSGTGAGGAPGTSSGPWDKIRRGGKGGGENPGGVYDQPAAGEYGGAAGYGSMTAPGGGGGGGFTDEPLFPVPGDGADSNASAGRAKEPNGGGGGQANGSTNGSPFIGGCGEIVFAVYTYQAV